MEHAVIDQNAAQTGARGQTDQTRADGAVDPAGDSAEDLAV